MKKASERFFTIALGVPAFVLVGHWIGDSVGGAIFPVGLFMGLYNVLAPFFTPHLDYAIVTTGGTITSFVPAFIPALAILAVACCGWHVGESGLMAWLAGQTWLPLRINGTGTLALFAATVGCLLGFLSAVISALRADE